jgi:hypothetical protein
MGSLSKQNTIAGRDISRSVVSQCEHQPAISNRKSFDYLTVFQNVNSRAIDARASPDV